MERPLDVMINIQNKQKRLDVLKKKRQEIGAEIRSLAQQIPKLIRGLKIQ